MQKQEIEIAGYKITKLSETEFEAANPEQELDFYFEFNEKNEVDAFVFDSRYLFPNCDCLHSFTEENLEEAVRSAMLY